MVHPFRRSSTIPLHPCPISMASVKWNRREKLYQLNITRNYNQTCYSYSVEICLITSLNFGITCIFNFPFAAQNTPPSPIQSFGYASRRIEFMQLTKFLSPERVLHLIERTWLVFPIFDNIRRYTGISKFSNSYWFKEVFQIV